MHCLYRMSTRVLLATLAIPISVALSETEKFMELDEIARDKAKRLSNLLNLQTIPTRASLLKDLVRLHDCMFDGSFYLSQKVLISGFGSSYFLRNPLVQHMCYMRSV